MAKDNFLKVYFKESKAFADVTNMTDLLKSGPTEFLPVQPIYEYIQRLNADQVAELIPYIPKEIRQVILDLDLWAKDDIDPARFGVWIESFGKCQNEEAREEFITNSQFALYLKSVFNIHSFDVEDPAYPDHDNYFLTDDNQLLFEYAEDFPYVADVKMLIQNLYSMMGVEQAYAYLFKVLVNSYLVFQESEYEDKVERLREYGFVDYYESLKLKATFLSEDQIKSYVQKKVGATGTIDWVGKSQVLNRKAVVAFKDGMDDIFSDLDKLNDEKRSEFLRFNFTRLINADLSLQNATETTAIGAQKVGDEIKFYLGLGLTYLKRHSGIEEDQSIFSYCDFFEVYKIGYSLVNILQKKVKTEMKLYGDMESSDFWGEGIENLFSTLFKIDASFYDFESGEEKSCLDNYELWTKHIEFSVSLLPFCNQFYRTLKALDEQGSIISQNYLNYNLEDIDFEVLLVTSYINFCLGNFAKKNAKRMAVEGAEVISFWQDYFQITEGKTKFNRQKNQKHITEFSTSFGFDSLDYFNSYLQKVLEEQLNGYELEEFQNDPQGLKHVGGPLIYDNKLN